MYTCRDGIPCGLAAEERCPLGGPQLTLRLVSGSMAPKAKAGKAKTKVKAPKSQVWEIMLEWPGRVMQGRAADGIHGHAAFPLAVPWMEVWSRHGKLSHMHDHRVPLRVLPWSQQRPRRRAAVSPTPITPSASFLRSCFQSGL